MASGTSVLSTAGGGSLPLILRSRASGVSKDEADVGASWFETAHSRFLTMRIVTK
jgi:hypothetical protein